jgi:hypothetical protein
VCKVRHAVEVSLEEHQFVHRNHLTRFFVKLNLSEWTAIASKIFFGVNLLKVLTYEVKIIFLKAAWIDPNLPLSFFSLFFLEEIQDIIWDTNRIFAMFETVSCIQQFSQLLLDGLEGSLRVNGLNEIGVEIGGASVDFVRNLVISQVLDALDDEIMP